MNLKKIVAFSAGLLVTGWTVIAAGSPLSITADELAYDGSTKMASVKGHVIIQHGQYTLTGEEGTYHTDTRTATLKGVSQPVQLTGSNVSASANALKSYEDSRIEAYGAVQLTKEDTLLKGDYLQYDTIDNYGKIIGNAYLQTPDATMTGDTVEVWTNEVRAIGDGNIHFTSEVHQIVASGTHIEYRQTPGEKDGVAYLSGNAYAEQKGNTLQGEAFTIHLADDAIQTQGRSTLVIQPR